MRPLFNAASLGVASGAAFTLAAVAQTPAVVVIATWTALFAATCSMWAIGLWMQGDKGPESPKP